MTYLRTLLALTLLAVVSTALLVWLARLFGGWVLVMLLAIVYLPSIILLPFLLWRGKRKR